MVLRAPRIIICGVFVFYFVTFLCLCLCRCALFYVPTCRFSPRSLSPNFAIAVAIGYLEMDMKEGNRQRNGPQTTNPFPGPSRPAPRSTQAHKARAAAGRILVGVHAWLMAQRQARAACLGWCCFFSFHCAAAAAAVFLPLVCLIYVDFVLFLPRSASSFFFLLLLSGCCGHRLHHSCTHGIL